jgi:subtilisin
MGSIKPGGGRWITPEEARGAIQSGTGAGVRIAVLDSGIETSHPGLKGLSVGDDIAIVREGAQLRTVPGAGKDVYGHGTAVAGIIKSIAPQAELGSFRVLGEELHSRTVIIREGAREAIERGYHILNCSFGCGVPDHVLHHKSWVDEAYLRNVHVVAACNSADPARTEWPAHFTSVIGVSMAGAGVRDTFYYRPGNLVEFVAPGDNVRVPWRDETMKDVTGSSFAAAWMAGMLARLLSFFPELEPAIAKALLHRVAAPWKSERP